jgi:UDP-N-acetylmuramoyl-tripeptide--D-alanyl-D-alanine ligase
VNDSLKVLYEAFSAGSVICTDTRNITPGCIFFCLKGERFDGNDFALQAVAQGAGYVVSDRPSLGGNRSIVLVEDVLACLQQFAAHHRNQFSLPVLAVTGSNGKTTTKELLFRVLASKFKTLCTQGNLNNHIGVPLTLLRLRKEHEMAVVEMGANHQREIALLCSMASPTHVLITNVGKAHLEGFGGFEGVKKGKGEMYDHARRNESTVFINMDNPHLVGMLGNYAHTVTYGTGSECDITGRLLESAGAHVSMEWKTKTDVQWHPVHSRITGSYNFENILSAVAAGVHFSVSADAVCDAVASYEPDNQRSQELKKGTNHIILDAYNANPTSMEAALKNFSSKFAGKRAVFLGDMFELGESSRHEHEAILRLALACGFDLVALVGPRFAEAAAGKGLIVFENSGDAAGWIRKNPLPGYNLLIKGSRGSKMEMVLEGIADN